MWHWAWRRAIAPVNPLEVHTPRLVSVEHTHLLEAMLFGAETGDAPLGARA